MLKRSNIQHLAAIEEGVPLWGCTPGSPAALAGLRYGDIVLAVNGVRTRTVEEYVAAKGSEEHPQQLVFRRGADLLSATIAPGPDVWPDVSNDMAEVAGRDSFWAHTIHRAPTHRD